MAEWPDTVQTIKGESGKGPPRSEYPPERNKWFVAVVQLKSPGGGSVLELAAIRVVDDSGGSYPLFALEVAKEPRTFATIGEGGTMAVAGEESAPMALLFAVPDKPQRLYLQIGDGERVLAVWVVVKISETAEPETVVLERVKQTYGSSESMEAAPEGQKWIEFVVELKAPGSESGLKVSALNVVDESGGSYRPHGIAYSEKRPWKFQVIEDWPRGYIVSFVGLGALKPPGGGEVGLFGEGVAALLFAVPDKPQPLYLQIGHGDRTPIALKKVSVPTQRRK